jgi:uncharacterized membrane protein
LSADRRRRIGLAVDCLIFLALAIWMTVYVAAEDSYRNVGVSRWNTYDAKPLTVVAIGASFLTSLLAAYAAARRPTLVRVVLIAGVITLILAYFLRAAMSN